MTPNFFLLGITLIFLHEMDAVRCKEWRIFPGLSRLDDRRGFLVFILAHVPLVHWVLLQIKMANEKFIYYFDIFLIVHLVLHLLFLRHPKNEFKNAVSWLIIAGAALCGLLDLIMRGA